MMVRRLPRAESLHHILVRAVHASQQQSSTTPSSVTDLMTPSPRTKLDQGVIAFSWPVPSKTGAGASSRILPSAKRTETSVV